MDYNEFCDIWDDSDERPGINYNMDKYKATSGENVEDSDSTIVYADYFKGIPFSETNPSNLRATTKSQAEIIILDDNSSPLQTERNITWCKINEMHPPSTLQQASIENDMLEDVNHSSVQSLLPSSVNQCLTDLAIEIRKQASGGEKDKRKEEQGRLREEKKLERMREKNIKAAIVAQQKNLRPEEAIKRLTVHIDTQIAISAIGTLIIPVLQKEGVGYRIESSNDSNTITWTKVIKESVIDDSDLLIERETIQEEEDMLEVLSWLEFLSYVSNGSFLSHAKCLQSKKGRRLTIVTIGMDKYYAHHNKLNRAVKSGTQQRNKMSEFSFEDAPIVSIEDVEVALCELQLLAECSHRNVENAEELAGLVFQMSRAISQKDFKQAQYSKESNALSWFAKADGKSCVKVDKRGNGLLELWQQQLMQFNNTGLEVAKAIVSQYGSPLALLAGYEQCINSKAAAELLENIPVRRDAGILSSLRRVGPELSKKIHRFLTSTDPSQIL